MRFCFLLYVLFVVGNYECCAQKNELYTIKKGDFLLKLLRERYPRIEYKDALKSILNANFQIKDPNLIYAGTLLVLPFDLSNHQFIDSDYHESLGNLNLDFKTQEEIYYLSSEESLQYVQLFDKLSGLTKRSQFDTWVAEARNLAKRYHHDHIKKLFSQVFPREPASDVKSLRKELSELIIRWKDLRKERRQ